MQKQIIEIKLATVGWGHPHKLPWLEREKMVETRYAKNKTPTMIWTLFIPKFNVPETKVFSIHAKRAVKITKIKSACLVKSRPSNDHGKKNKGISAIDI